MDDKEKAALRAHGWKVGTAADFLGLSGAESAYVEAHLRLSRALRDRRKEQGGTQLELAGVLGSSQSRVAKAEAASPSVSLDFLVRALFALGASVEEVGATIGGLVPHRGRSRKAVRR